MTEYKNDARIDRVGTVRKLGDAYFVKLVEPVSEPWHLMWSEGPQQVSGWQDDETMTSAVEVGYAPILECVPGAATQTAEQAQQLTEQGREELSIRLAHALADADAAPMPDEWDSEEAFWKFMVGKAVMPIIDELRPGSPVTETTKQDEKDALLLECAEQLTTNADLMDRMKSIGDRVINAWEALDGESTATGVTTHLDAALGALRDLLRERPALSGVTSETEKR